MASCSGAILGAVAAVGGLAINEWNVLNHGASYRSYRFDAFTFLALPGMLIAENRFGADFQLGEILLHKPAVIGWNALVYALLGLVVFPSMCSGLKIGNRVSTHQ